MRNRTSRAGDARIYVDGEPEHPTAAAIFATIRQRGGMIGTIHRALAAAPAVLEANYNMAIALRLNTKLPRALGELTILRTVQLEGGRYEFEAHREMALKAGLTEQQISVLADWQASEVFSPVQRAVLGYADALHACRDVPDHIYDNLAAHLDAQEIVELTVTAGFYVAASRLTCGLAMRPER
jgi:alkylhydroperoxidase family enzyme